MGETNTPGTAGGPGGRDQMLAVKSKKMLENQLFFVKKFKLPNFLAYIFYLCQNIGGNKFPHTGDSLKCKRWREKERKNDGSNNGQRKPTGAI